MTIERNQSEFKLTNIFSWRSFSLSMGMVVNLLVLIGINVFIDTKVKYMLGVILVITSLILFVFKIKEMMRTSTIIVSDHHIIYEEQEIMPDDIDEIVFTNWVVDIKRKKGMLSHIRLTLKEINELEQFKRNIMEYSRRHSIKVRM